MRRATNVHCIPHLTLYQAHQPVSLSYLSQWCNWCWRASCLYNNSPRRNSLARPPLLSDTRPTRPLPLAFCTVHRPCSSMSASPHQHHPDASPLRILLQVKYLPPVSHTFFSLYEKEREAANMRICFARHTGRNTNDPMDIPDYYQHNVLLG